MSLLLDKLKKLEELVGLKNKHYIFRVTGSPEHTNQILQEYQTDPNNANKDLILLDLSDDRMPLYTTSGL